jgi:hypothetical protein
MEPELADGNLAAVTKRQVLGDGLKHKFIRVNLCQPWLRIPGHCMVLAEMCSCILGREQETA